MCEELRECPFCGGEDVEHLPDWFGNWLVGCVTCQYRIQCVDCNEDEAVRYWNTRPAEDALKAEVERLKNELGIQKNLTGQMCFENKRAYNEVEKWKEMFYDLCDKQARFSTDPKLIVINPDTGKGGEDE